MLSEETSALEGKIKSNEIRIESNIKSSTEIINKTTDQEDRSRRNNLIFYNIPEHVTEHENKEDCEKVVVDLLKERKFFKPESHIYIDRAYRLGRFKTDQSSRPRPIIVRFCFFKDKQYIIANGRNLKDCKVNISEDYSKITLDEHKMLRKHGQNAKETLASQENEKAITFYKVAYKRLIVTYTTNRHKADAPKFTKSFTLNHINDNSLWYLPPKNRDSQRNTYHKVTK